MAATACRTALGGTRRAPSLVEGAHEAGLGLDRRCGSRVDLTGRVRGRAGASAATAATATPAAAIAGAAGRRKGRSRAGRAAEGDLPAIARQDEQSGATEPGEDRHSQ